MYKLIQPLAHAQGVDNIVRDGGGNTIRYNAAQGQLVRGQGRHDGGGVGGDMAGTVGRAATFVDGLGAGLAAKVTVEVSGGQFDQGPGVALIHERTRGGLTAPTDIGTDIDDAHGLAALRLQDGPDLEAQILLLLLQFGHLAEDGRSWVIVVGRVGELAQQGENLGEDFALLADDVQLLWGYPGALEFLLQVNRCA